MESEIEYHPAEREILPKDLREFFVRARRATYAGNAKPVDTPLLPRAKELVYTTDPTQEPNSPYYYYDSYDDRGERPGNFAGAERITSLLEGGDPVLRCQYVGGLTNEGLKLGEGTIYGRLQRVLKEHVEKVRFGNKVKVSFADDKGDWVYEDKGMVEDWGWSGRERIYHKGILVYDIIYGGNCYLRGF
ncbi:MAG: hypothetical protein Q7S44_04500 [bacterium]|nr:hypothetical protein [bacterium]